MNDEDTEYEYRVLYRECRKAPNGVFYDQDWSDWSVYRTGAGKTVFKTEGTAKGLITRDKRYQQNRWNSGDLKVEYRIQKRPIMDGWVDC